MNYVLVDHEKHALCDDYIVELVPYATENYYERGKYGYRNFHVRKNTPLHVENLEGAHVLPSYACCFVLHLFIFLQISHA